MRKVVFIGLPAFGHTNPTLGVVKELVDRGVKVIYYNTEQFRDSLERAGAEFRGYRSEKFHKLTGQPMESRKMHKIFVEIMPLAQEIVEEHLEEIRADNADCIVYDSMATSGPTIAAALNLPGVCSNTTFAINDAINMEMFKASTFREKLNFGHFMFYLSIPRKRVSDAVEVLTLGLTRKSMDIVKFKDKISKYKLVYTSKSFQPRAELFDASHHFIGPSVTDRRETLELPADERALIYISIGTVFSNPQFFKTACEAFGDGKYRVLLSIGKRNSIEDLENIPSNFIVRNYFPQLEVLKRAALFVSHCGMNSAHESLYHGVPIIGLPQMAEQALVASSVEKQGAGIYLRRMNADKLRAAAEKILADENYRRNCLRLSEEFKRAGGAVRAADLIMEAAGIKERVEVKS